LTIEQAGHPCDSLPAAGAYYHAHNTNRLLGMTPSDHISNQDYHAWLEEQPPDPVEILSLGAGVQSSTLALMAARGDIKPPKAAIFADTGWEPAKVYDYLEWLEEQLPFPVYKVNGGNIRDQAKADSARFASLPFFTEGGGMARRQCTAEFKIDPVNRKIRELVGLKKGERAKRNRIYANVWIGITTDEAIRMKPSRLKWIEHKWPLIDKRMNRNDCLQWFIKHGYRTPPKSACIGCPYHSNASWRELRDNSPEEWADAVAFDYEMRDGYRGKKGQTVMKEKLFLHRSCVPLDQVDLSTDLDRGQMSLFGNECEGMCGV